MNSVSYEPADLVQSCARFNRAIAYVRLVLDLVPHLFEGARWGTLNQEQRKRVCDEASILIIEAVGIIEGTLPRAPAANGSESSSATPPVQEEIHNGAVAATFPGQYL